MFYVNEDYKIWTEIVNGEEKYFIEFFNADGNPNETEITYDISQLYLKEFNKPIERQRNEKRRRIAAMDSADCTKLCADMEEQYMIKAELEPVLDVIRACSSVQRKRFALFLQGFSNVEIANLENCNESAVRKSINLVLEKITHENRVRI